MPGLRSLRNRLAVIFALIILGAIGTIYLSVTPRLEASLTSQRLDQVRASAAQYTPESRAAVPAARRSTATRSPDAQGRHARPEPMRTDRDARVRRFAERVGTEIIVMSVNDGRRRSC